MVALIFGIQLILAGGPSASGARSEQPAPPASRQSTPSPSAPAPDTSSKPAANAGVLTGRPSVTAPRTNTPPAIDGRLDDPVWQGAARITAFVQQRPFEGAPASEQTEVLIAYDSRNLYFAVYAHYSNPGLIRANHADRDQTSRDDTVSVIFDPFLDQQRAYLFSVNAYGVQGDAIMSNSPGGGPGGGGRGGGPGGEDSSWNALFSSAGMLVDDGWTAEMAIPFKSLRYPAKAPSEPHRWGFQIQRDIESKNESVVWSPVSRNVMGALRQMGLLEGVANLSTSRNLEILPTFTATRSGSLDTTSGRFQNLGASPQAGLNAKYGITSNLTADFTINPDFSQIESDRAQIDVNQRFPLFYPELRPFFLEGQEIFQIRGPVTVVHTRTIVDPRFGVKLSGKVGKTTLGVLFTDDEAPGRLDDAGDPAFGKSANVFMGRVRYDLYSESYLGMITTDREFMGSYSRLVGFDGQFRLGRNQRGGIRFVQSDRRDAAGLRRSGPMLDMGFRRESKNVSFGVMHFEIHPDFGADTGFVSRVDVRQTQTNAGYRWWPESWIVNWGPGVNYSRNYDFTGVLQDEERSANVNVQFARNINLNAGVYRNLERYGGIDFWKTRQSFGGGINTSRRISVGGFFGSGDQVRYVTDPFLGRGVNFSTFITLRPVSRLQSQIDVSSSHLVDPRDNSEVFDVKIYRGQTTYQFTDRLLVRNITEYNSLNKTLALNVLLTYRVNAGTVFFAGYDDHQRQGNQISQTLFPGATAFLRTNRTIFAKLQYLFRY